MPRRRAAAKVAGIEGSVIGTFSGRYVDPLNLQPDDVSEVDIIHALAHQCRFSGHVRRFYSVAEHSVRVSLAVIEGMELDAHVVELSLWGLLHDASEAYLVDLPRPLKDTAAIGTAYRKAEHAAMAAIAEHFQLWPDQEPPEVKEADLALLATERRDLMPENGEWTILHGVKPLRERIHVPWSPEHAKFQFERRFGYLMRQRDRFAGELAA